MDYSEDSPLWVGGWWKMRSAGLGVGKIKVFIKWASVC
jgi:hypothetical protein